MKSLTTLKEFRETKGVSQSQLTVMTGIATTHISTLENGSLPSIATLRKLCKALDCLAGDLVEGL